MSDSQHLFQQAKQHIPGGVNSPVRAFGHVGGDPIFFRRGEGAYLYDVEENRYIDYVGSWGPMIVGHAHPQVVVSVQHAVEQGLSFGTPTEVEVELADKVCQLMPSMDMVRMVNSGTEAAMSAIRLARGFTGRDKIIKFVGCYHGHCDSLLVRAGSGGLTFGVPDSAGVPAAVVADTILLPYNNLNQVSKAFEEFGHEIAGIIVEPVAGNMNCILPAPGFLQGLRELCDQYSSLLIFDEVMTGFRVSLGGAQERFGVKPDLTMLGKVIGGGAPVGAFGGRADIMQKLSPLGPVYQAGTLSGNPIAMTAGLETLKLISEPGFFTALEANTINLVEGIMARAADAGVPMQCNQIGGMFGLFFTKAEAINTFDDVMACDTELFKQFFHGMLEQGIYLAPSPYEVGFVSSAHTDVEIEATLDAAEKVLSTLTVN